MQLCLGQCDITKIPYHYACEYWAAPGQLDCPLPGIHSCKFCLGRQYHSHIVANSSQHKYPIYALHSERADGTFCCDWDFGGVTNLLPTTYSRKARDSYHIHTLRPSKYGSLPEGKEGPRSLSCSYVCSSLTAVGFFAQPFLQRDCAFLLVNCNQINLPKDKQKQIATKQSVCHSSA